MQDIGNHAERVVDIYQSEDLMIDTYRVSDHSGNPFETAVKHPHYNQGKRIIVETYLTKEEAQQGHNRWLQSFTCYTKTFPVI